MSNWSVDGNQVRLGMDFAKVDKKRRMVAGWATVDNVDQEGDQVTAEASLDAFARSRMNLREMHKKDSAVGRIVSFQQRDFRAPNGDMHKGIFVKVYISKGAEDTWQKVLDKTLNGFSVGGVIVDFEEDFAKDSGEKIRKVTKYNLNELSLVDNPGNEYSDFTNIFKIRESADGSVTSVSGMIEEFKVLNVYYCDEDGMTIEDAGDSLDCPVCGETMEFVGSVEDDADRGSEVSTMVQKFISTEGGAQMTKINKTKDVGPDEEGQNEPTQEQVTGDAAHEEVAQQEEAEGNVEEVEDEGRDISKAIDSLKEDIQAILKDNSKRAEEKIEALEKSVNETRKFVEDKVSELDAKVSQFDKSLDANKSRLSKLEKLLNKVNSGSAFRKSADAGDSDGEEQDNSAWNGAFSVKNLVG